MAQLNLILPALDRGHSVRRAEWDSVIRMFLSSELLMCQCGNSKPWPHALGWDDLAADDWCVIYNGPTI
jgi:hypothetical protein